MGVDPQALPDRRPAVAQIGFLLDVRFAERDQSGRLGVQGALQQGLQLRDEGFAGGRRGAIEQGLGLLPGEAQAFERLTRR